MTFVTILLAGAFACARAPAEPASPAPRDEGKGRIAVVINGLESAEGQVLIALFLSDTGWPDDESAAHEAQVLPIELENLAAETLFENVPAGPFAISVFHDKDSDRELDTGFLGIPSEPYGFSRDARDTFGPPEFEEARLELAPGETARLVIKVE